MSTNSGRRFGALLTLVLAVLGALPTAASATSATCTRSVRVLQERLSVLGFPSGVHDGCAGPATRSAVQAFQRSQALADDGIAGAATRRALASPRPVRPFSRGAGAHVEVDLARQLLLVVRGGRAQAVYAVSTGRAGYETPVGRFRVASKEVRSWSTPYGVWLPWASYFAGGVAVHAGRVERWPASHGCVRVEPALARAIYDTMPLGMAVIVR